MRTRSIALLSCLVVFTSCDESPTSPTSTPGGTCQTNNTAQVSFQNQSRSTRHDIVWNNENIATLAPGTVTTQITVQAGVAHRLEFRIANTTTLACQPMTPTLSACAEEAFSCALP